MYHAVTLQVVPVFAPLQGQVHFHGHARRGCGAGNEPLEVRPLVHIEFRCEKRRVCSADCDDRESWEAKSQASHFTFCSSSSSFRQWLPNSSGMTMSFARIVSFGKGKTPRQHRGKIFPRLGFWHMDMMFDSELLWLASLCLKAKRPSITLRHAKKLARPYASHRFREL